MSTVAVVVVAEVVVVLVALLWTARRVRTPWLTGFCAFLVGLGAACSVGIAIQALFMQATGGVVGGHWLAFVWMILGMTGFAIAGALKAPPWVVASPCGLIAIASLTHSLVCREPLGGMIGVVMIIAALVSLRGLRKRPLAIEGSQLQLRHLRRAGLPEPGAEAGADR
jgi:hypothetical protein